MRETSILIRHTRRPERLPYPLRRNRNVDMSDAQMPQRIHYCVGNRWRSADRWRLPNTLRADRMVRRGSDRMAGFPLRRLNGSRQQVIGESSSQARAIFVINDLLI